MLSSVVVTIRRKYLLIPDVVVVVPRLAFEVKDMLIFENINMLFHNMSI